MAHAPVLHRFGLSQSPVLCVDALGPEPLAIQTMAAALGKFPSASNNYPGLRRIIRAEDVAAWNYVVALLEQASPYLAGAFDLDGFDLVEASFSLVTTPPAALSPVQRLPHFDSVDDTLYAVLHYLAPCDGTAFFRHAASAIELVTPGNCDGYVAAARRLASAVPADFIRGTTADYVCIGTVEGVPGRLAAYPARFLHSGIIPAGFAGSPDPMLGRLTTNIFIRGRRDGAAIL